MQAALSEFRLSDRVEIWSFFTVWLIRDGVAEAKGDVISSFIETELIRIGDLREVDDGVRRRLGLPENDVLARWD
jgi:hypothetical protein